MPRECEDLWQLLTIISATTHPKHFIRFSFSFSFFPSFYFFLPLGQICLGYLFRVSMDSQGTPRDTSTNNPGQVPTSNAPAMGGEGRAQGNAFPHSPFFPSFPPHVGQMPFLFPHAFMPPLHGVGFAPPVQGTVSGNAELPACSQKPTSQECAIDQSKTTKKRRLARKKPEIIELDNVKDEVNVVKSVGPWKDHWVIQLITIRGEMHSTFAAPPKQGDVCEPFFFSFPFPPLNSHCLHCPSRAHISCKV